MGQGEIRFGAVGLLGVMEPRSDGGEDGRDSRRVGQGLVAAQALAPRSQRDVGPATHGRIARESDAVRGKGRQAVRW